MKIVALLAIVWLALMSVAAFGAFTGDTSLLVIAVTCGIPVSFLISMLMGQYRRK